jgi:UDP-N-acetylmuramoyl-L-alanyl-D-glutamate--2,6-diaminopimelate ligase
MASTGITGTNGKTTTAYLVESLLNAAARKTVLVGTIEYHVAGDVRPSVHTTPESRDLFELMAEGVSRGATELVTEVSSHALDQGRAFGVNFDVAIFTNLTRDHLDYHKTLESYYAAKRLLFDGTVYPAPASRAAWRLPIWSSSFPGSSLFPAAFSRLMRDSPSRRSWTTRTRTTLSAI